MVRRLSYLNSMSDIVYKKCKILDPYNNVQLYCFQSAEIKEHRGSLSDNYY